MRREVAELNVSTDSCSGVGEARARKACRGATHQVGPAILRYAERDRSAHLGRAEGLAANASMPHPNPGRVGRSRSRIAGFRTRRGHRRTVRQSRSQSLPAPGYRLSVRSSRTASPVPGHASRSLACSAGEPIRECVRQFLLPCPAGKSASRARWLRRNPRAWPRLEIPRQCQYSPAGH